MHLILGNSRIETGDYNGAIQLFERARAQTRYHTSQALSVVSLVSLLVVMYCTIFKTARNLEQISGWKFDDLAITVRRRLCEALYAAGRINEAGEALLNIVNTVDEAFYMAEPIVTWLTGRLWFPILPLWTRCFATDLLQRCLSTPENRVDQTSIHRHPHPS
jgi:hypothetical protein